jgi:hypothetical protein
VVCGPLTDFVTAGLPGPAAASLFVCTNAFHAASYAGWPVDAGCKYGQNGRWAEIGSNGAELTNAERRHSSHLSSVLVLNVLGVQPEPERTSCASLKWETEVGEGGSDPSDGARELARECSFCRSWWMRSERWAAKSGGSEHAAMAGVQFAA